MIKIAMDSSTKIGGDDYWIPVFLKADRLQELWDRDSLARDVSEAYPEAKKVWFMAAEKELGECMTLGRGSISEERGLSFDNGRHRTRWLLDLGLNEIPVFLTPQSYVEALFIGALSRRAFLDEPIPGLDRKVYWSQ